MGFHWQFGGLNQGPAALSLSLNTTDTTIAVDIGSLDPEQAHTIDTSAGQADSTATASGGDESYTFAWTITETSDVPGDSGASAAVLAAGTPNAAQYNTATFRVSQAAQISGGQPVSGVQPFQSARYRLRCTVTDGNSDTATADYFLTLQAQ